MPATDDEGDAISYFSFFSIDANNMPVQTDASGNAVSNTGNSYTFTPATNFTGQAKFIVYIQDAQQRYDSQVIIVGVGYYIRTQVTDSPIFTAGKDEADERASESYGLIEVFRRYPRRVYTAAPVYSQPIYVVEPPPPVVGVGFGYTRFGRWR